MEELKALLRQSDADLKETQAQITELIETTRKARRQSVVRDSLLGVGMLLAIVAVVIALVVVARGNRREHCIETWANDSTSRTTALARVSTHRQDALDRLVRTVAAQSRTEFEHALAAYLRASDQYRRVVSKNPIPIPNLHC